VRLSLPPALRAQILDAAKAAHPGECCGLVIGHRDGQTAAALALHPARNLATHDDRFEIDPADHFAALKAARADGLSVIGCYHSHPQGRAQPSATDLAGASEDGFFWLIAAGEEIAVFVYSDREFRPGSLDLSVSPGV
jgi:proteasome lid subunit RPN8/RPN11